MAELIGLDHFGLPMARKNPASLKSRIRQCLACFTATLTMVTVGTIYGWTTTSLLPLTTATGDVPLNLGQNEYSWIVSLTVLCSMVGSLVGALFADLKGRKYCLILCSAMFLTGWIIIYAATSVRILYVARVIQGIGVGIAHTVNPMYVSEVADISFRGRAVALIAFNVCAGSLLTCILGYLLTYETIVIVLAVVSFISFLSNTFFPETPYFLVAKARRQKACKSITYYKAIENSELVKTELLQLRLETRHELYPQSRYQYLKEYLSSESNTDIPLQLRTDLPSQSRTDLPSPSGTGLPSQSRTDLPSQARTDLPSQARTDLPSQSRTDLPSQSRTDLPSQSRTDLPSQSRTDLPSQARTDLPSQARTDLPSQSRTDLPSQSRTDLPSQARTDLPSPSGTGLPSPSGTGLPSPSGTGLPSPSGTGLPSESRSNYTSWSVDNFTQSEMKSPSTSKTDLSSQSKTDSSSECRSDFSSWSVDNFAQFEMNLPSTSKSNLPPQTITEGLSDPIQKANRKLMFDLHLGSSSNSSSISVIHSQVVCDVHPQPRSELRLQASHDSLELPLRPSRALRSQSASELHRPSTSEIRRRSTSEIRRRSTSEIQRPTTSAVQRPSTSEIQRPSTSAVQRPSTSAVQRPSTSAVQRPSTSAVQRPSTSPVQRPSTSAVQRPSTSAVQRPSTSAVQRPSTSAVQRPSTSPVQRPSTSPVQRPSTSPVQRPSTSPVQRPSTSPVQRTSTSPVQRPSTSAVQRPSTSAVQRPSTSAVQRPSTSAVQRPSTSKVDLSQITAIQLGHGGPSGIQFNVDVGAMIDLDEIHMDGSKFLWLAKLRVILQRSNWAALIIMLGLIMERQLSGNYVTMQYLEVLLRKSEVIDTHGAINVAYLINVASGIFTITMVDYMGRKKLLYISTVGSIFSLFGLTCHFLCIEHKINCAKYGSLPIVLLIVYQATCQLGLVMLPNVFLCDLFPTEQRGFVGAIIVIFDGIIGFTVSKLYQLITDNVGWSMAYLIFTISCAISFVIAAICIPETKRKTHHEIRASLFCKNLKLRT